jgi:CBS domain containing-hemolysin-like protein
MLRLQDTIIASAQAQVMEMREVAIMRHSAQTRIQSPFNEPACCHGEIHETSSTHDSARFMREPGDREQLVQLLHSAYQHNLLDADALSMIEGVLQFSELQARDIMVPRSQMDVIDVKEPPDRFIPLVIQTGHSRFPVIGENKDDVIGILLAKDLLRYYAGEEEFNVREMLRPAVFIPESKRLNVLLKEFRANRNHMAIVVDEYGGVAGLLSIEDVIEQIVGDIEDEYDFDETEDNIIQDKQDGIGQGAHRDRRLQRRVRHQFQRCRFRYRRRLGRERIRTRAETRRADPYRELADPHSAR